MGFYWLLNTFYETFLCVQILHVSQHIKKYVFQKFRVNISKEDHVFILCYINKFRNDI